MARVLSLWVALLGVGCGGGGSPTCHAVNGQNCQSNADCCSDIVSLSCIAGVCQLGACHTVGAACTFVSGGTGSDCCGGLSCSGGKCVAPCKGTAGACSTSADCCSPLTCSTGKCLTHAVCAGTGHSCLNSNDCCSPLVCAGGACASGASSVVTWTVTDRCNDADTIDYRFFDDEGAVSWPGGAYVYTAGFGQSYQWQLVCKTGDQICVGGADTHNPNAIYGVGLNDAPACSGGACCFICTAGAPVDFSFDC